MTSSSLRIPWSSSPAPPRADAEAEPFVLQAEQSTAPTLAIIGSGSVVRYLTPPGEEFAVVQSRGRADEVVPAHMHRHTHDIFLPLSGSLTLYLGGQVRTLHPGDFASAPPGTAHAYQITGRETEFLGVIAPGSWVEFFNYIAEPFEVSPLYPATTDKRPFPVGLFIEGIKAGSDVVPLREYDYAAANPVASNTEDKLPDGIEPYYLLANTGPKYLLGNQSLSPLITSAQSSSTAVGGFSVLLLAGVGSAWPSYEEDCAPFASAQELKLPHAVLIRVEEGKMTFRLSRSNAEAEGEESLTAKESIFIPALTAFSYRITSAYARCYIFAGKGEGLERVFAEAGRRVDKEGEASEVVGERREVVDREKVKKALEGLLQ